LHISYGTPEKIIEFLKVFNRLIGMLTAAASPLQLVNPHPTSPNLELNAPGLHSHTPHPHIINSNIHAHTCMIKLDI